MFSVLFLFFLSAFPDLTKGPPGPGNQLGKIIVDAGDTKIRFPLEGGAQRFYPMISLSPKRLLIARNNPAAFGR